MRLLVVLGALMLLAGCGGVQYSDPYGASPQTWAQSSCEQARSIWRPILGICEHDGR